MQRVLSSIHEANKDKTQIKNTENQKQIYLTKMIQMMDYYDYKPDKIDDNIIKQTYDDNTTLDEFIMNISNDINPASPSNKDSKLGKDDRSRATEGYGLFPCQQPETITEPLNNGLYGVRQVRAHRERLLKSQRKAWSHRHHARHQHGMMSGMMSVLTLVPQRMF